MRQYFCFLLLMCANVVDAQTSAVKRLIAEQRYLVDTNGHDSLWSYARFHYYDSSRGSRFDYNDLLYLRFVHGPLSGNPVSDATNIDSAYFFPVAADSVEIGYIGSSSTVQIRSYLSNHRCYDLVERTYDSSKGSTSNFRAFDVITVGRVTARYILTDFGNPSLDTEYVSLFQYDALGRLIFDSTVQKDLGVFYPRWVSRLAYGSGGSHLQIVSGSYKTTFPLFVPIYTVTDTFDAFFLPNGQVSTSRLSGLISSGLIPAYVPKEADSFGYTSGVPGYTFHRKKIYQYHLLGPDSFVTTTPVINAMGRRDSVVTLIYQFGVLQRGEAVRIFYDTSGDPIRRNEYQLDRNMVSRLTAYEIYQQGSPRQLGVAEKISSLQHFKIFPIPTTGLLNVVNGGNALDCQLRFSIVNTIGQTVYERLSPGLQRGEAISLNTYLPAGVYHLVIYDDRQCLLEKCTVTLQ